MNNCSWVADKKHIDIFEKFLKELNKDPILKVKMDIVNRLRGNK